MSMFKDAYPIEVDGYEEIASSATVKGLTGNAKESASAALICNSDATDGIYYTLDNGDSTPTAGLVIKPQESIWLSSQQAIQHFQFRAIANTPRLCIQYFTASPA